MDYFTGIDIGTTSTKVVAFSASGEVLAAQSFHYPLSHSSADRSELNINQILEAVLDALIFIAASLADHNPVLVSFSAAMHSLILIDKNNQPLTDCIIWADNRAAKIAGELKGNPKGKAFYHLCGVPVHAMSPFCKIIWFKENEPELFTKATKFIGIKEFIFYRLFNKYIIDTGIASATGLLNINLLQWDKEILKYAGVKENQLSSVVKTTEINYLPADKITGSLASLAPFKQTAFVIGSNDGGLANLGLGAMAEGSMAVTIGTSGAVRVATNQVLTDEDMRSFCFHLTADKYIFGGASNNGAIVIQWLKENIIQDKNGYETFIATAETIPAGCNNLIFLPYILGERAPWWNSNARGMFFGLDINHTAAHMVRAAMEAVVYNMYAIGKILMSEKNISIIYANGGFAASEIWIQILADMFNLPVFVPSLQESSCIGAVIIGMNALGIEVLFDNKKGKNYLPDSGNHAIYLEQFKKSQRLYNLVKDEF